NALSNNNISQFNNDSAYVTAGATVGYATTASYSTTSGTSGTANYSYLSGTANYAITAGTAGSSLTSTTANYATSAGSSLTSSTANYALTANYVAGSVGTANYAVNADYASTANYTTTALTSITSNYSLTAGTSDTANYSYLSGTANYALNAAASSTANYAVNADYASTANYATTAGSVNTANYALVARTAERLTPNIVAGTVTWNLPTAQGTTNSYLQNDGLGNLSWVTNSALVYGSNFQYAQNNSVSTTFSTSFVQKLRLTTHNLPAGTYKISWSYAWNHDSQSNDFLARIEIDDSNTIMYHQEEPQDDQGSWGSTGSNQKFYNSGFAYLTLSGVHTIDLDYRTDSSGDESSIWEARLEIVRVE
ncbi:MAG: hypothetical protein KKA19_00990, partial [Candidatus Margulisbacteria bacterium]|nr:hypothetical protein [Candidatus Margulisiibacteriota bacterium]